MPHADVLVDADRWRVLRTDEETDSRNPREQQAAQVAVLLLFCAALVLLVRLVGGAPVPRWTYAVGPLVGALLWPVVTILLQWPQRPRRSQAEV